MTIEWAARDYLWALADAREATGPRFMAAQVRVADALHELILAVGDPCFLCDPGTCPGETEGRILVGNEYRRVEVMESL